MTTRKAAQSYSVLSTAAIVLFAACCGTALAATEIPPPSPDELASPDDSSLVEILKDNSVTAPAIRTVENAVEPDALSNTTDEAEIPNTEMPVIATRLPGISASNLPRVRRQMFRTDI